MSGRKKAVLPLITEKTLAQSKAGRYTFIADPKLHKGEIKRDIESAFKVSISKISSIRVKGQSRSVRGKKRFRFPDRRKVIVSLSSGKIEVFEKV